MNVLPIAWGPSIALLSLYHWMMGVGLPEALQLRVTLPWSSTVTLEGLAVTDGALTISTSAEYNEIEQCYKCGF